VGNFAIMRAPDKVVTKRENFPGLNCLAATEKWAGSFEKAIPIILALILGLIVIMAVKSDFDKHPDERHHYDAAKYYLNHWLPPPVGAPETIDSYSRYGFSYLNELDLVYLFAGKFTTLLSPLITKKYLAMRLFNGLLFLLLVLYCFVNIESRLIFIVVLITPQVWYIFSYFNNDAISFFVSIIIIFELAKDNSFFQRYLRADKSSQFLCGGVMMGLLLGLLILCKRNYYIFIAFILFIIIWQIWEKRGAVRKQILLRYLFVIGLGLSMFSLRYGYDVATNGWDKADKMVAYAEKTAMPSYKPSIADSPDSALGLHLKAKGVKYYELFSKWGWLKMSFGSFFGVYDYMKIKSPPWYYIIVLCITFLFSIYLISTVLVKGESADKIFLVSVLGFVGVAIFASTYHSWVNDFQAQGRYLFPILGMLGLLLYRNQKILNRSLVAMFVISLCGLSFYSFIFTGLCQMLNLGA
jgi:hypothetical protein